MMQVTGLGRMPIVFVGACLSVVAAAQPPAVVPSSLVAPGATLERVASGFAFVEGPVADGDGGVLFSDIPNNRIHRWSPSEGLTTVVEDSGRANGLRLDASGTLLVCEMATRQVTAINADGTRTILADRYEDQVFNSPNDLWVDPKGGIYFSDPHYGPADTQQMSNDVYYISPDRTSVSRVADGLVRPNGIIGSPDGARVYIADHGAGRTYVYTPAADGTLHDRHLFVEQGADGMTMDEWGNLYLTGDDITVVNPEGEPIASIAVPEPPANLTFGGDEGRTLFITARTSLYALEMTVTGQ